MFIDDSKSSINKVVKFDTCDYWVKPLQKDY